MQKSLGYPTNISKLSLSWDSILTLNRLSFASVVQTTSTSIILVIEYSIWGSVRKKVSQYNFEDKLLVLNKNTVESQFREIESIAKSQIIFDDFHVWHEKCLIQFLLLFREIKLIIYLMSPPSFTKTLHVP